MRTNVCLNIFFVVLLLAGTQGAYAQAGAGQKAPGPQEVSVLMEKVREMAEELVKSGFTAGDGYGEVWIRDFNTFIEVACKVNDRAVVKKHLLTFFKFQQDDGQIIDGYIPAGKAGGGYKYIYSELAPEYAGHKNTVETDQESSLIQAVARYIHATGDTAILNEPVGGMIVEKRLEKALDYLFAERFNEKYGLIWGATTADWGDVQPEHSWGVELDSNSHLAIDIYDNAMLLAAIRDYLDIAGGLAGAERKQWEKTAFSLRKNIRKHLWDEKNNKFIPHVYLDGSPFPASFNEDEIFYHGGTAVAIEAGLLNKKEIKESYEKMQENVRESGAPSIGLTLYPVYPEGFFQNEAMVPYSYQNGGDWTWFGGRMVTQLARNGFREEALEAIRPMVQRVVANNGFYEWFSRENEPRGSGKFRGSAGVLWRAIKELTAGEEK